MTDARPFAVGAVAVLGLAILGYVAARKLAAGVASLPAGSFNPASQNNVAYKAANSVVAAATGDPYDTVGLWAFRVLNPGEPDLTAPTIVKPRSSGGASGSWDEPAAAPETSAFWYGAP